MHIFSPYESATNMMHDSNMKKCMKFCTRVCRGMLYLLFVCPSENSRLKSGGIVGGGRAGVLQGASPLSARGPSSSEPGKRGAKQSHAAKRLQTVLGQEYFKVFPQRQFLLQNTFSSDVLIQRFDQWDFNKDCRPKSIIWLV